jgi:hypothetical protein
MFALDGIVSAGPDSLTSLCGMTSSFMVVSVAPFVSVSDCDGLYAPPLTDHEWQPRNWCLIVRVVPDRGLAVAARRSEAPATARTDNVRVMSAPFGSFKRGGGEGASDQASR